jgi:quercetin dioxygenase-like cupin family protein
VSSPVTRNVIGLPASVTCLPSPGIRTTAFALVVLSHDFALRRARVRQHFSSFRQEFSTLEGERITIAIAALPAGFSTGLHVHRVQEETFYVLEGECEWQVGDQIIRAKPGAYLFIPPGVPHNIASASDRPARMIMTVSPPGHEYYFEELVTLVARSSPPDANAIAEFRSRYDTEQLSAIEAS